jgi:hypothetical protein
MEKNQLTKSLSEKAKLNKLKNSSLESIREPSYETIGCETTGETIRKSIDDRFLFLKKIKNIYSLLIQYIQYLFKKKNFYNLLNNFVFKLKTL